MNKQLTEFNENAKKQLINLKRMQTAEWTQGRYK
jgi:hypothetical protein